jgi:hypothetical protein
MAAKIEDITTEASNYYARCAAELCDDLNEREYETIWHTCSAAILFCAGTVTIGSIFIADDQSDIHTDIEEFDR